MLSESNQPINQISFVLPADLRIRENARKVLSIRFEHPDWTHLQISEVVGISKARVGAILSNPRVLAALPMIGRQFISGMVPDAVKAYKQLVNQDVNLQVKEKAANKILTEKKVLDAPTVRVEAEITFKAVRELQEIVQKAAAEGFSDVVDAEIIPDTVQDTTHPDVG